MDNDDLLSEIVRIRGEESNNNNNEFDEKVYIAVSKKLKACKSTLVWALENTGGKKLCFVHVHQPSETISILGGNFPLSLLSEREVRAHQEKERQHMNSILDEYVRICAKAGVQGEKLYIEMRTVENGLVKLITQHKIERLVMGAAADDRYSRKMVEPKSKKAKYVRKHAPDFCHIWFICKARLIYTREGTKLPLLNYKLEDRQIALKPKLTPSSSGWSGNISMVNSEESFDDVDQSSTFSLSHLSIFSRSSETATESTPLPLSKTEDHELSFRSLSLPPRPEEKRHHSQSANLLKMSTKESLLDQLEQAIADAKIAKQETFQESYRRHQAEKEATDAIAKATAMENSFHEELRRRKKLEEELENTKQQRDTALEQLQIALNQNSSLESQSDKSNVMAKELEDRLMSTLELFQKFRQP
ncbi:hypothetical protein KSS87_003437 [Heliosperma pusillum]|nr:hypothetical protein KSS87_003437 [Heliosperma pusillum]